MFDLTIVRERHPQVTDFTAQLILAGLYHVHEMLEKIMSDQDTVNDVATQLASAGDQLTTLVPELTAALQSAEPAPLDLTALQSAAATIASGVSQLAGLIPAPLDPGDGSVTPTDSTA